MLTHDAPKTTRLSILVSKPLKEALATTAESRGLTESAFVREAVEREIERSQEQSLSEAAEALAPLYESDEELTAFQVLDGEDFA